MDEVRTAVGRWTVTRKNSSSRITQGYLAIRYVLKRDDWRQGIHLTHEDLVDLLPVLSELSGLPVPAVSRAKRCRSVTRVVGANGVIAHLRCQGTDHNHGPFHAHQIDEPSFRRITWR